MPVGPRLCRNVIPDICQTTADLADDVVGAVFVTGHDDTGNPVVGHRASPIVRIGDHGVHTLGHALGHRGGPADPRRRRDDQDFGRTDPRVNLGPLIATALIAPNAGLDVQTDHTKRAHLDSAAGRFRPHDGGEGLGVRRLRGRLQGAIEKLRMSARMSLRCHPASRTDSTRTARSLSRARASSAAGVCGNEAPQRAHVGPAR